MGEIKIYMSAETRSRLTKTDPAMLRDFDSLNAEHQDKTNARWNNEQGPKPSWDTKE